MELGLWHSPFSVVVCEPNINFLAVAIWYSQLNTNFGGWYIVVCCRLVSRPLDVCLVNMVFYVHAWSYMNTHTDGTTVQRPLRNTWHCHMRSTTISRFHMSKPELELGLFT